MISMHTGYFDSRAFGGERAFEQVYPPMETMSERIWETSKVLQKRADWNTRP